MSQVSINIGDYIKKYYPEAKDCAEGHIGETVKSWFEEADADEDRYHLMIIERCSHCGMPNGKEEYVEFDDYWRYWNGEQP